VTSSSRKSIGSSSKSNKPTKKKVEIKEHIQPPKFQYDSKNSNRYELWSIEIGGKKDIIELLNELDGMQVEIDDTKPLTLKLQQDDRTTNNEHIMSALDKQSNKDYVVVSNGNTTSLNTIKFDKQYKIESIPKMNNRFIKAPDAIVAPEITNSRFRLPYNDVKQIDISKKRWNVMGSAKGHILFNSDTNAVVDDDKEERQKEQESTVPVHQHQDRSKNKKRKHDISKEGDRNKKRNKQEKKEKKKEGKRKRRVKVE